MNWYKHYIGDFMRDTGHLSLVQVGAYRALIDHYYSTEIPLPVKLQSLFRICRAHSQIEQEAVVHACSFFSEYEGRYHHKRIDKEIAKYQEQAAKNRRIAVTRRSNNNQYTVAPTGAPHGPLLHHVVHDSLHQNCTNPDTRVKATSKALPLAAQTSVSSDVDSKSKAVAKRKINGGQDQHVGPTS